MSQEPLQPIEPLQLRRSLQSEQRSRRRWAWIWSLFIVLICLAPHNPGPPSTLPLDKLAHFLLFAVFGVLWLRTCPRKIWQIALAGTLLGLAIEIAQSVLGWGRMGDAADFLADFVGLGFGLGFASMRLARLDRFGIRGNVKQH